MFSDTSTSQLTADINKRIYSRNLPSQIMQPYLNVRPVMTKYSIMPIIDPRKTTSTPMSVLPQYSVDSTFNPGTRQAPWSGYASNVNLESELRNQIYALQKCSQAVYVPDSNSDLYNFNFNTNAHVNQYPQLFPGLFQSYSPPAFNPNTERVGMNSFNNHTRQQLKNL
jgi:hypothetical protein